MSDAPGIPSVTVEYDDAPSVSTAPVAEQDLLEPGPEDEDIAKVLSMDPEAKARRRIARVRATRAEKMQSLFEARQYKIVKEVSVDASAKFTTPLGNRGRRGYVLRQQTGSRVEFDFPVNAVHKYLDNGMVTFVVGKTLLKHAAERFGAILDWGQSDTEDDSSDAEGES